MNPSRGGDPLPPCRRVDRPSEPTLSPDDRALARHREYRDRLREEGECRGYVRGFAAGVIATAVAAVVLLVVAAVV